MKSTILKRDGTLGDTMVAPEVHGTLATIDRESSVPLYRQLYAELRQGILTGTLPPGMRLPATRIMAADLNVSRNTVINAFEQLIAEGFLEGQIGAGTYVARSLPDELLLTRSRAISPLRWSGPEHILSRRSRVMSTIGAELRRDPAPRAFRPGLPALDQFPIKTWTRLAARRWRTDSTDLLGFGDPLGHPQLRRTLADYLAATRGLRCSPEQIIVTAGTQQALDLVVRVLLNPGDAAWMEDPGYVGMRAALLGSGARLVPVPVDDEGMDVDAGRRRCPAARLAYVTPSHQCPLGVTMSLTRRLALLEWANWASAWIIEDDYDSEYRYSGRTLSALQGLDAQQQVIYLGTFGKVLFPSLRLGYLVVPPDIVGAFTSARTVVSRFPPSIDQVVLADFVEGGYLARHIRSMRILYAERQKRLIEAVRRDLAGVVQASPSEGGMHVMGWLPTGMDDRALFRRALTHQVEAVPLSHFTVEYSGPPGVLLGYGGVNETEIRDGVKRLAVAMSEITQNREA